MSVSPGILAGWFTVETQNSMVVLLLYCFDMGRLYCECGVSAYTKSKDEKLHEGLYPILAVQLN